MPTSTVTSRGQTTIPKPIRDALGLQPGDRVEFILRENEVVVRRSGVDLTELDGLLARSNREAVSIDEMDAAIEDAVREETRPS